MLLGQRNVCVENPWLPQEKVCIFPRFGSKVRTPELCFIFLLAFSHLWRVCEQLHHGLSLCPNGISGPRQAWSFPFTEAPVRHLLADRTKVGASWELPNWVAIIVPMIYIPTQDVALLFASPSLSKSEAGRHGKDLVIGLASFTYWEWLVTYIQDQSFVS